MYASFFDQATDIGTKGHHSSRVVHAETSPEKDTNAAYATRIDKANGQNTNHTFWLMRQYQKTQRANTTHPPHPHWCTPPTANAKKNTGFPPV